MRKGKRIQGIQAPGLAAWDCSVEGCWQQGSFVPLFLICRIVFLVDGSLSFGAV
jgi:hypothetical protein